MERGVRGGRWSLAWLMTLSESELPPPSIVAGEPVWGVIPRDPRYGKRRAPLPVCDFLWPGHDRGAPGSKFSAM